MTYPNENKNKIIHPLWTHLPAAGAAAATIIYLLVSLPLPAEAPVHFDFHGTPDGYGAAWVFPVITVAFSIFFIGLSVFMDELWARQEKKKAFNWFSCLDEVVTGWMAGMSIGYLAALNNGTSTFNYVWVYGAGLAALLIVINIILEWRRPYRGYTGTAEAEETPDFEIEITRQIKSGGAFVYWDSQNPFYVTLLATLVPLIFVASTIAVWLAEGWLWFTLFYAILSTLLGLGIVLLAFGGQRTVLTRQGMTVRWGAAGLKVLKLKTSEIIAAELHEFAPLRDFGGYGIRFNREMQAYFLRGKRGVKITTTAGKKYLIGSDRPERLLKAVQLITGGK